jgi:dolichol-phosphate mannosyltransferase
MWGFFYAAKWLKLPTTQSNSIIAPLCTSLTIINLANFSIALLMSKSLIVIPTFNEADNLPEIVAAIFEMGLPSLNILVVDDNSPDGTGKVADNLAETYAPRLHVIHRKHERGLGTAYITGFKWALEHQFDYVIQMDADFSHSPTYIPQFLHQIQFCDVVIGSRYVSGGSIEEDWSAWRWFLSWWANSVWVRLFLDVNTKDATAGFKCWTRNALEQINLNRIKSNGYVFQVEMCYVAEKLGLHIQEWPIHFEDRRIGQSKMTVPVKIEAALRVFEIRLRHHHIRPGA